jgi:hypothetical protein
VLNKKRYLVHENENIVCKFNVFSSQNMISWISLHCKWQDSLSSYLICSRKEFADQLFISFYWLRIFTGFVFPFLVIGARILLLADQMQHFMEWYWHFFIKGSMITTVWTHLDIFEIQSKFSNFPFWSFVKVIRFKFNDFIVTSAFFVPWSRVTRRNNSICTLITVVYCDSTQILETLRVYITLWIVSSTFQ